MKSLSEPEKAALEAHISEDFVLASGPGGQNVNKVSSAVVLRLGQGAASLWPIDIWARLKKLAGRRMRADGVLVLHASRFRSQDKNRADARARLYGLIEAAFVPPPPPRKATKPTKASITRRIDAKKRLGQTKQMRKPPRDD